MAENEEKKKLEKLVEAMRKLIAPKPSMPTEGGKYGSTKEGAKEKSS
ncbi:MAG: hypothetical protein QXJ23_10195 [Thermofilum sp.]